MSVALSDLLKRTARERGLGLSDLSGSGGWRVVVAPDSAPEQGLTIWLRTLSAEEPQPPHYSRGTSFLLGYEGQLLPPFGRRFLDELAAALRQHEARHGPLTLEAFAASAPAPKAPVLLAGGRRLELRITQACDEQCLFCNSQGAVENLATDEEAAVALVAGAAAAGATILAVTGGEPFLVPWLPALVARARAAGFARIVIQTNGVRLGSRDGPALLAATRPDELLISLHGPDAEVAGRVNGRPESFDATITAISRSLDSGIRTAISFVLCSQNLDHAPATVRLLAALSPPPDLLACSLVAPTGAAWRNRMSTIPRMVEAAPRLLAALTLASELGLAATLVESCGLPICVEPRLAVWSEPWEGDLRRPVPADKVKVPVCAQCPWDHRCTGIFRGYAEMYGEAEFGWPGSGGGR